MSEAAEAVAVSIEAPAAPVKIPLLPLIFAVIAAMILSTAGACGLLYWLLTTGKVPLRSGPADPAALQSLAARPQLPTSLVPMEPLLVNLADEGGRSYLRVGLTLRLLDPPTAKDAAAKVEKGPAKNENEAAERDAALAVLGKQTASQLLAPDGKEQMKQLLKTAFTDRVPEIRVQDVLITEFLVQQ